MATFKVCVRNKRKDGFYPVYIGVTHHSKIAYIKTDKLANEKTLGRKQQVEDPYVLRYCSNKILEYAEQLNKVDIAHWTVNDIVAYLHNGNADVSFSDYARKHRNRMIDAGQERNARNYELAYQHLERFAGTTKVMFSHLTSTFINAWIKSLEHTKRAKEMYPVCIRQIFKAAQIEYNDYDNGIIRINTNPWVKVQIPQAERPEKLAITPEACRAFFSAPIPESKFKSPLPELGRDVALMVLCLGGINTVDLYHLKKADYYNGIIHYRRAKTKKFRTDGAYFEMRVPPILQPTFNKYLAEPSDEYLFNFHERHTTSDSFNANANIGIKRICEAMGLAKEDWYCVYTFRHTWGTIAQNDCGATIAEVAFAMNHSAGYNITRGYIKMDFSPAWKLNDRVIDLIFFTETSSSREHPSEENSFTRFSPKYMIHGSAFFRGKLLGEIQDIGFSNVDEVITKLFDFVPDHIPVRSIIQFKIENVDKQQTAVYERMKTA